MRKRRGVLIMGAGVVLAACGGPAATSIESAQTPTTGSVVDVDSSATTPTMATTVSDDESPAPEPSTSPEGDDGASGEIVLAIEPAMLPDDALPPPWEIQRRDTDAFAYSAGPNQTNCAPYWRIEELRSGVDDGDDWARGRGHAMWWIDGGYADHYVTRVNGPADPASLADLAGLAEACPVVSWDKRASFTVESIPLDDGIGFKFTDVVFNETTWFGVTAHGDLVSVLEATSWVSEKTGPRAMKFDDVDLNRLVSQMYDLLVASPVLPNVPTATTLPRPVPTATTTTTTTTTTDTTDTTATVPLRDDGLVRLLLQTGDLPDDFGVVDVDEHFMDSADDGLAETCPAAISIERIDRLMEWTASAMSRDDFEFRQIIGRAATSGEAAEIVAQFAQIAECDLSGTFGDESMTSGGSIDVIGSDATANLLIENSDDGFAGELIVFAVDEVMVLISLNGANSGFDASVADELAVRAVKKIAAATR